MKNKILILIEELKKTLEDIDKVENREYGYKSAAVRSRKICQNVINALKELRKEIQASKNQVGG